MSVLAVGGWCKSSAGGGSGDREACRYCGPRMLPEPAGLESGPSQSELLPASFVDTVSARNWRSGWLRALGKWHELSAAYLPEGEEQGQEGADAPSPCCVSDYLGLLDDLIASTDVGSDGEVRDMLRDIRRVLVGAIFARRRLHGPVGLHRRRRTSARESEDSVPYAERVLCCSRVGTLEQQLAESRAECTELRQANANLRSEVDAAAVDTARMRSDMSKIESALLLKQCEVRKTALHVRSLQQSLADAHAQQAAASDERQLAQMQSAVDKAESAAAAAEQNEIGAKAKAALLQECVNNLEGLLRQRRAAGQRE